jgi:hypothetical protein
MDDPTTTPTPPEEPAREPDDVRTRSSWPTIKQNLLRRLTELDFGELLPTEELQQLTEQTDVFRAQSALRRVRRELLHEHKRYAKAEPGRGYVILPGHEHAVEAARKQKQGRDRLRIGLELTIHVDSGQLATLTPSQVRQLEGQQSVLRHLEAFFGRVLRAHKRGALPTKPSAEALSAQDLTKVLQLPRRRKKKSA